MYEEQGIVKGASKVPGFKITVSQKHLPGFQDSKIRNTQDNSVCDARMSSSSEEDCPPFTPNEAVDSFTVGQSAVEYVGYVDGVEPATQWGSNETQKRLKFILNNSMGRRVSVVVWNDDVERVENIISPKMIMYLDGAHVTSPKQQRYNKGNTPFELTIRPNTTFEVFGKYNSNIQTPSVKPAPTIELRNVMNSSEKVSIECYIKTPFAIHAQPYYKTYIGTVTDLTYFLEVRIAASNNLPNIQKGEKVKITGSLNTSYNPPHFFIEKNEDVEMLEGSKKSRNELMRGFRPLKRIRLRIRIRIRKDRRSQHKQR